MWALVTFSIAAALAGVHVVGMALASAMVGAMPKRVQLGYGPSIVLRRAQPEIRVGLFPIGGYVLHDDGSARTAPAGADRTVAQDAPGREEPASLSLAARIGKLRTAVVLLSGNVALLALAVTLGGPAMLASAARLPLQLAWLLVDHASAVEALHAFARRPLDAALVAVVAAKLAALNLLPLPSLNGGQLLALVGRPPRGDRGTSIATIGTLLLVLVLAASLIHAMWSA